MHWLVYQTLITEEKIDANTLSNKISILPVIRKVEAETKAEAIGKFILDTESIRFTKRIDPIDCFEFDKLKSI